MNDITCQIICSDELVISEDSEIIEYMRVVHFRINQDGSKFQVFWGATAQVIDKYTRSGANI